MSSKKEKTPEERLKELESLVKKGEDKPTYMDEADDASALDKWESLIEDQEG